MKLILSSCDFLNENSKKIIIENISKWFLWRKSKKCDKKMFENRIFEYKVDNPKRLIFK